MFVQVAEKGSFTAAAAELGVLKSSVSRSVAALEATLGVRLLHRTTRRLHLTEAGQAYLQAVRPAVSGIQEASAQAADAGTEPQGLIRMTAPESFEPLAPILARFLERYPKVRIDLMLTGRRVDLVAEGFDLAVRAGALPDSTLVARKVEDTELGLYASKRYLRLHGRPARLSDLAQHKLLLLRAPHGRAVMRLTGPDGEESVEVTGPLSVNEMRFIWNAAEAGMGIALLPAIPGFSDALVRILPKYHLAGQALYVVVPSARHEPARVALLRETLVRELRTTRLTAR
jgi:DNA-binding transcriptional LysR family regulator